MNGLILALLGAWAAASEPPQTIRFERKEDCLSPGAFEAIMGAGAQAWGVEEGKSKEAVERLEAAVQCRAFAGASEEACRPLGLIPKFPAAKHLERNCRAEHNLLAFYDAMALKDPARAERACARWYELNKDFMLDKMKGEPLCRRLTALLSSEPASACERLGEEMADAIGDARERAGVVEMCRIIWGGEHALCLRVDGLPFPRSKCAPYGRLWTAVRERRAAACPPGARYNGLCRAMLEKDPAAACGDLRKAWQELICAGKFEER